METIDKLKVLGAAAKYDICSASGCGNTSGGRKSYIPTSGICHSFTPDGRCVALFKVLQSNVCQKDCKYCPNRAQNDIPRASFAPEELASLFMEFYRRNYVEGIFLSSGIYSSSSQTMENLIRTAELLRQRHQFKGYIHLKILPGAKFEYVETAAKLADRVSVNIEAPTPEALNRLSNTKNFHEEIITRMSWVNALKQRGNFKGSQSTQFIVGAADEKDSTILKTSSKLYSGVGLSRVYFSAFQPVHGTPLQEMSATPVIREHRLYQSDFLLRQYGFTYNDLCFDKEGNLPLDTDPKTYYATKNLHLFPMEVNKASYHQLLRVPGIGPTSAARIVKVRRSFNITSIEELKNIGVVVKRAAPFIVINGKFRDSCQVFRQLELWSEDYDTNLRKHPFGYSQNGTAS